MDFTFSEDQLQFQEAARDFLVNEVTPEHIRSGWETDTGRSDALWRQLAELGLTGMLVPEEQGGLGLGELDFVLLAQECGYVALPEPLVLTALVVAPLLTELADSGEAGAVLAAEWLPKLAAGEARIALGMECNLLVEDAATADLLLLQSGDEVHALTRDQATLREQPSVDPSRRLSAVAWQPSADTLVAGGERGRSLWEAAFNRGALGASAQLLGLSQRMMDLSVQYSEERHQFGKPIGSFQAVKHHMADIAYRLEYARPPAHRAAYALARGLSTAGVNVSQSWLAAAEVADIAARNSIQVHGAMGYTWEVDLHLFIKKAWAHQNLWGGRALHKQRVADFVLAEGAPLGAGNTFLP